MGAPKKDPEEKKRDVTISPSKPVRDFIEARVATGEFRNKTHGFERAVQFYMNNEDLARRQIAEGAMAMKDKSIDIKSLRQDGDGDAR